MLTSVTLEPRFMFPRSLSLPAWVMAKLSPDYCHSLLLTMSDEEKRKFLRTLEERPRLPARSQHPRHPLGQVPQRQLPLRAPRQRLHTSFLTQWVRIWRLRITGTPLRLPSQRPPLRCCRKPHRPQPLKPKRVRPLSPYPRPRRSSRTPLAAQRPT